MKLRLLVTLCATFQISCVHRRYTMNPADTQPDVPGVVARLSYLRGPVSFQPAGVEDWAPAELNRPMTAGDSLWIADGGRAVLDAGAVAIRLDSKSSFKLLDLDDNVTQLSLTEGAMNIHLRRRGEQAVLEVDTPNASIALLRAGEYRIDVDAIRNVTRIVVRAGEAEVARANQAFPVAAGKQVFLSGDAGEGSEISTAPPRDEFDIFSRDRDVREERAESLKYVSGEMIGCYDLDEHGAWEVDAVYGPLWAPRVIVPGWTPYRFGHWVWIEPWGWTWIDEAPWGFAPFHYGRWLHRRDRWFWAPGPRLVRPVYAPALVVFVGGGGHGFRFFYWLGGGAGVAWFPLSPGEIYIPPYRASRNYLVSINVSNTRVDNRDAIHRTDMSRQRYANQRVASAFTAVPRDVFVNAEPVHRAAREISPRESAAGRVNGSAAPVAPSRSSLASSLGRPAVPGPSGTRRPVLVRREPPAPVSFEVRRQALERSPGRPPDPGSIDRRSGTVQQKEPEFRRLPPAAGQGTVRSPKPAEPSVRTPRPLEPRDRTIHQEQRKEEQIRQSQKRLGSPDARREPKKPRRPPE